MLAIRMQRTGRKGHAQFRVVVQDSRRTPSSGRVVAQLGHFNPHTKETVINKEKAQFYLDHGAQPSERVVRLLKAEGIKLPSWVKEPVKKERTTRNMEKLRKNRPVEEAAPETPTEDESASTEVVEDTNPEEPNTEEKSSEEQESAPADEAEKAPEEEKSAEEV